MLEEVAKESEYVQLCTVLTAYAESDFRSDAVQRETIGVFQQNPKYWDSANQGTRAQCRAFIADLKSTYKHHTGEPVHDCWMTQRWLVPNGGKTWPDPGPGFYTAPETRNYTNRIAAVTEIIREGRLP